MSKKPLFVIVAIVIAGLGLAYVLLQTPSRAEEIKQAGPPVAQDTLLVEKLAITANGKNHVFDVEIARTPAEQAYGLMNRKSMGMNYGMLFLFQTEGERSFWMRNTLIPLDMIFIREDGTIHSIHESAIPHDLTPVLSQGPALAVLEINGGRAAALGIKPGDRVIYRAFKSKR